MKKKAVKKASQKKRPRITRIADDALNDRHTVICEEYHKIYLTHSYMQSMWDEFEERGMKVTLLSENAIVSAEKMKELQEVLDGFNENMDTIGDRIREYHPTFKKFSFDLIALYSEIESGKIITEKTISKFEKVLKVLVNHFAGIEELRVESISKVKYVEKELRKCLPRRS